jgi:hypothetical protein
MPFAASITVQVMSSPPPPAELSRRTIRAETLAVGFSQSRDVELRLECAQLRGSHTCSLHYVKNKHLNRY